MLEIFNIFLGAILGLIVGIFGTVIQLNSSIDNQVRQARILAIDQLVGRFHEHYSPSNQQTSATTRVLDYELKSLLDDTVLIPILGKRYFEKYYSPEISKFYLLSLPKTGELSGSLLEDHIGKINKTAVRLKKMVNHKTGSYRFTKRK